MEWEFYGLLGVLAAVGISSPLITARIREVQLSRAGLKNLHEMTDEDMILHLTRLFGALGYRVQRPAPEEDGFDLVLSDGLGQRRGVLARHWRRPVDEEVVRRASAAAAGLGRATPMVVTVSYVSYRARLAAARDQVILWSLPDLARAIGQVREAAAMEYPDLPAPMSAEGLTEPEAGASAMVALFGAAGRAVPGRKPVPAGRPVPAKPAEKPALHTVPTQRKRPGRLRPGERWDPDEVPRCPRCGKRMVVRKSTSGEYWGCPNFPRCLGTKQK